MSQINSGLCSVANGSATVTGDSTSWTSDVSSGDLFVVVGDIVSYEVSSVVSDTELTLTAPYGGTSENLVDYVIHTAFTTNKQYPYPERGDFETATIVKRAIKEIDDDNYVHNANLPYGLETQSGDGTTTTFTIAHGLSSAPDGAIVTPASSDAAEKHWVSNLDTTNIEITYATAPPSATDNLSWYWSVKVS